jgi:phosphoribosylaminoimidazole-succinocarboxamide synthase
VAQNNSYEGKAKRVTPRDGSSDVEVFFKDDATAFNGQKHAVFPGKGALNSEISALLFEYLARRGIPHHYKERLDDRTLVCTKADMFAIEAVVRFEVAGSLAKRTGLPAGSACDPPVVEFYYKRDDLGDPIINQDHIRLLKLATPEEMIKITELSVKSAVLLHGLCKRSGIKLVDLKFEFGRTDDGIILADEISPDTCRFHDAETGRMLDKDLFRQDAGDLLAGYKEVHERLEKTVSLTRER